jgi:phage shock protein A
MDPENTNETSVITTEDSVVISDKSEILKVLERIDDLMNNIIEKTDKMNKKLDGTVDKTSEIDEKSEEQVLSPEKDTLAEKVEPLTDSSEWDKTDPFKSMEETLDHTNAMLDGIVSIYKAREYRREYGEIAYRRRYLGEDDDLYWG